MSLILAHFTNSRVASNMFTSHSPRHGPKEEKIMVPMNPEGVHGQPPGSPTTVRGISRTSAQQLLRWATV